MNNIFGKVLVNSQELVIPESGRLTDLLHSLQLDGRYVIVELNGEALFKDQIASTRISPGDRLEIVRPVAGG